jgi:hypothetical protein
MKKYILSLSVLSYFIQSQVPVHGLIRIMYFNLFTQSIIKDKSYLPFLLSYSTRFYDQYKQG